MKSAPIFAISGLLIVSSTVAYSGGKADRLVFRDRKINTRVQIEGDQGFIELKKSFELRGNVLVKQIENGLTMHCEKATGDLVEISGKTEFDNVHLTGGVKADLISEKKDFHATGSQADYDIKESTRNLKLSGGVVFDLGGESEVKPDPKKPGSKAQQRKSALNVRASDASVNFRVVAQNNRDVMEVQTATLTGPIHFNGSLLTTSEGKVKHQNYTVDADRLTYTIKGESGNPEVRLTGNIQIKTSDDSGDGPDITGAKLLVLILNNQNEILKVNFSSGGEGRVKATFPSQGKGDN